MIFLTYLMKCIKYCKLFQIVQLIPSTKISTIWSITVYFFWKCLEKQMYKNFARNKAEFAFFHLYIMSLDVEQ